MRLFGIMMARDEADVIEASVRHNLTILDGLLVIDHGSRDATARILRSMAAEGLALGVVPDESPPFLQGERVTPFVRRLIVEERADFVFALDADEFLKVPSRSRLEATLGAVPDGVHAVLHWQTYVPERFDRHGEPFTPAHAAMRLAVERHGQHKAVIASIFASRPTECVARGNHLVFDQRNPEQLPRHARIPGEIGALAHFPVRSRQQVEAKVRRGRVANAAVGRLNANVSFLYDDLESGVELDPARLRQLACNYGVPREAWLPASEIELVHDPVAFTAELRYSGAATP